MPCGTLTRQFGDRFTLSASQALPLSVQFFSNALPFRTFSVTPNMAPGKDLTGAKDKGKINRQINRKAGFGCTGLSDGETAAHRMLGAFILCS